MVAYTRVGLEAVETATAAGNQLAPSIAGFTTGGFVMVWQTSDVAQDGSGTAIKLQRYDSNGVRIGSEILVNFSATGDQKAPSVTALASGGYVVTWETTDTSQDGSGTAIKAQIYDASGAAVGGEFRVNSQVASNQTRAEVTALGNGNFAVVWQTSDASQDGFGSAIKGQIYTANGAPVGGEFLVNQAGFGSETLPSVTGLSGGGFLATWTVGSGPSADIYAQIFDVSGAKLGSQFLVNTTTMYNQNFASASQLSDGRFIVTWQSTDGTSGFTTSIRAQIYAADGTRIGSEFIVNSTANGPGRPQVDNLPDGGFIVTWGVESGTALSTQILAQQYDATGNRVGGEFTVNTRSDRFEGSVALAVDGNGSIFSAWESYDSQTSSYDVHGQFFSTHPGPVISSNGGADNATVFHQENQASVMTIAASNPNGAAELVYSIIGGADASYFTINSSTGALSFVTAPNFEFSSPNGDDIYDVVIAVSDGTYADVQAISVNVTNVNESPTFNAGPSVFTVSENQSTIISTFTASDPESDPVSYSLSGVDAARFTINATTGALSWVSPPDHESPADADGNNSYLVTIVASDGSLTRTKAITINVSNVNEAATIVSGGGGDSASVSVSENGTGVMQIQAVDPEGSTLTYSISGGADAARFAINATTGELSFVTAPDREDPSDAGADNVYDVVVRVSDGTLTDTQALAVSVTNVNESLTFTSAASFVADENGVIAATVSATDADGDTVTYSITGGADGALFTIDPQTGVIRFATAPDFEAPQDADANNIYDLLIAASDGSFIETSSVSIAVANLNEAVTITSGGGADSAIISIAENDAFVTAIAAADPDGTAPSYTIAGGADAGLFAIDAATGALSFINAPDFEVPADADLDNVYDVIVAATDGVTSDTQSLAITVTNSNEGLTFVSASAFASAENSTAVGTITATDLDGDTVTYSIVGGDDAGLFTIDPVSGALAFASAPNFETPDDAGADNVYNLLVQASDGSLTAQSALIVTVGNVNEGVSITSAPSFAVAENELAVGMVTATDLDGDAVTYAIVGGADAAKFSIDPATGLLSFVSAPNFEAPGDADGNNVYDVIVSASDGSLDDVQVLAVTVGNANEGVSITSASSFSSAENGVSVGTVTASDLDGDAVTFAIVGGADAARFTINSATGVLSFVGAPNFEAPGDADGNNVYDVIVSASDGSLSDVQALAVAVTNVNEAPVITSNGGQGTASVTIAENNQFVTTVTSNDPEGSSLTYAIVGGADAGKFVINATTGQLSFAAAPNFETPGDAGGDNVYDVTVQVSDGSLTDSQSLAISIGNVVDGVTLTGTSKADTLTGGTAEDSINGLGGHDSLYGMGGADTINGGDGNDKLYGGAGADRLTGGAGADTFFLTALSDSSAQSIDLITDFVRSQGDRISLSGLDANSLLAGDQAFSFIGTANFSQSAGQLRYYQSGGDTFISGDVNGDGIGDFVIAIDALIACQSSDFLL